jgi:DnaJ homolog subfamily C member 13
VCVCVCVRVHLCTRVWVPVMARDAAYGEQVQRLLDDSSMWAAYRDQRHDLFLTQTAVQGLLTAGPGSGAGTKGYLMAPSAALVLPTAPPPMDD